MVSMKGILYTTLGAAAAAALVGTMLTPRRRSSIVKFAKDNSNSLFNRAKQFASGLTSQSAERRAEYTQASHAGHA